MQSEKPLIYIIAGEPSGDLLGARLIPDLISQDYEVAGIGGPLMESQGLTSLFPMEELSIIGIMGILKRLPDLIGRINETVRDIREKKPDVLLTIDSPEFSFRVQEKIHKLKNRPQQFHLVAPTVWAWRPGRAKKIAKFLDHLLCLYPMEPPLFEVHGLKSTFVGHPITEEPLGDGQRFRQEHEMKDDDPLLCLLPGSRTSEITSLLPIFMTVADKVQNAFPNLKVVMPTVSKQACLVREMTADWHIEPFIVAGEDARRDAFAASHAALAASGTVSMQLAHAGVPMVVAYKIGPYPRSWMKLILQTPWVCMINILLGREAVPEMLQTDCEPEKITRQLIPLMQDAQHQSAELSEAMAMLRDGKSIVDKITSINK